MGKVLKNKRPQQKVNYEIDADICYDVFSF